MIVKIALSFLMLISPYVFAQSSTSAKLKFELARKLIDDGAPFQCNDTASEIALLLISSAGYSWNNVWNDTAPLKELQAKLQEPANKKLKEFADTNFAFKIISNSDYLTYMQNKVAAVTKALPGSAFHELNVAGAVITYVEFQPGGVVTIHNPVYNSGLHVTGTYTVSESSAGVFVELKFQKPAEAASYDAIYRIQDDLYLNSLGSFTAPTFDAVLEVGGWPTFSSDRDQTECADH